MKGDQLRILIRDSGIKLADIAKLSGIPEQTIYSLYKKENIERHYLDKLKNAGIKFNNQQNIDHVNEPLVNYQSKNTIDILADALSKAVDALTIENKSLRKKVDEKDLIIHDYIIGKADRSSKAS